MGKSGIMLLGNFVHSLDEKNRLLIPSKLRSDLSDRIFLVRGYEGTLSIYPKEQFEKYLNHVIEFPFEKKENRDFIRLALSNATELEIDSKFRIQLPNDLVNKFHISKEVVIVGLVNHLEIWDLTSWKKYEEENQNKFEEISERLLGE